MEEDRLGLLQRARNMGIPADPKWSAVRLRRELGDALDAPAPGDEMAKLEAELASLRKMAAMQAEIDALKAQIGGKPAVRSEQPLTSPLSSHQDADEIDELRSQLTALGVEFHHRHGATKLRELLDMATAPEGAR
jgi:phage I-like protein